MERELARRCRRQVRVAEFVARDANKSTLALSGDANSRARPLLFAGYLEVLYARKAWLAVRVDIWANGSTFYRQVRSSSFYLQESEAHVALEVASGEAMANLQQVKGLGLSVATKGDGPPTLTGDELTGVLEEVAQQLVEGFGQQVQLQLLQSANSQRAKFEYEILQHHPGLEALVLKPQNAGSYVLFALPLLEEEAQKSVNTPNGFNVPNFPGPTAGLVIFIGYPMNEEDDSNSDNVWPLFVEWPARMELSSQVTQIPPSSKAQSSVELISLCKQMFLLQWRRRKEFIAELRRHVIVLEYDAVDFSQTFFMLQEQLNAQTPLRIIVLRLRFTAAYFLTNCMSDLQVAILDGEGSIAVSLAASSAGAEPEPAADTSTCSQACVALFLQSTRKSLLQLFYGE